MEEGVKKATLASSASFVALDAQVKGLSRSITEVGGTGLDPAKFKAFGESLAGLSGGQASQFIGSLDQVEQRIARAALSASAGVPKIAELHGSLTTLGEKAEAAGGKVGGFAEGLGKLAEAGGKAATGGGLSSLSGVLGDMAGKIPVAGLAIGGLLAGLGALGGFLEHIVNEESQFAFAITAQNTVLGLNTDLLQTLDHTVEHLGGSQENVTNGLR